MNKIVHALLMELETLLLPEKERRGQINKCIMIVQLNSELEHLLPNGNTVRVLSNFMCELCDIYNNKEHIDLVYPHYMITLEMERKKERRKKVT